MSYAVRPPVLVLRELPARIARRSARDAALRMLAARFGAPTAFDVTDSNLYDFQREGAARALDILDRFGGVLVADGVGLGKTHIAAALARIAISAGLRVAVVGPASLKRHWLAAVGAGCTWISYARLSRLDESPRGFDLVVFDEAHALRNPSTRRYRAASRLCEGARVVLLSATPVNNSLRDLYHLLRLFAGDRHFTSIGVPSMSAAFAHAESTCLLGSTPSIQPLLRAIMVRRTREEVRESFAGDTRLVFPERAAPRAVGYALARDDEIERLAAGLRELTFPAHDASAAVDDRPVRAIHASARSAPLELMRIGLLKRLESSRHAFLRTLDRYDSLLGRCHDAASRGFIVRAREGTSRDSEEQLCFEALLFGTASAAAARRYRTALARERDIVLGLRQSLDDRDAKLDALVALLQGELRGMKAILFTQFRDTARYLHDNLRHHRRCALIDGVRALLGSETCSRLEIVRRFAPRANDAAAPPDREAVDLLIATDVLSEGFNLQDASVVISYDLPWNPIRLVQRVGRVDRLGSSHATVSSYHFLPGELERYLGLVERLARKSATIEATTGVDATLPHAHVARALRRGDHGVFDRIEREDAGPVGIDERLRHLLASCGPVRRSDDDAIIVGVVAPPTEATASRAPSGVVAAVVGARFEWVAIRDGAPLHDDVLCARIVECAIRAQPRWTPAVNARVVESLLTAARRAFADRAAAASSTALLPVGGPAAALGRRLLRAAAALPGGLDAPLARRLEAALERLVDVPDAAVRGLPLPPGAGLGQLLGAIEGLGPGDPGAVGGRAASVVSAALGTGETRVLIVAALVEVPSER